LRTGVVITIGVLALLSSAPSQAATIHVDCARAKLQKKINHAAPGSRLEIEGTCRGTFLIQKNLKLAGDPRATLDGNGSGPTLTLNDARVRLAHLVVTGGRIIGGVQAFGAGINATTTRLTLDHVVVRGNVGRAIGDGTQAVIAVGGGILSQGGGSLALVDSVVKSNKASARAGIARAFGGGIERNGSMTLVRSRIEDNTAVATSLGTLAESQGGGLLVDEGNLLAKSSTVHGNVAKVASAGGPADAEGGGIFFSDALAASIRKSILSGNDAEVVSNGTAADARGGGIAGAVLTGLLAGTRLSGNTAHADSTGDANAAGGGASLSLGSFTLESSRVASNLAEADGGAGNSDASGGGLDISGGSLALRTSTLDRNTASAANGTTTAQGGGLATTGDLALSRSTVSRNRASAAGTVLGGGLTVLNAGKAAALTNSTIARNKALGSPARGGGIDTFGDLDVTSSTVVGNSATIGGGIYRELQTTTLLATLVAGNSAADSPQCSGPLQSGGWNLISSTTQCVINEKKSDRYDRPARIGKLGDHGGPTETVPIGNKSPAKNAIPGASCPVGRDQRGIRRPQGRRCDIGAFERKT
jgi:hypothetical protein